MKTPGQRVAGRASLVETPWQNGAMDLALLLWRRDDTRRSLKLRPVTLNYYFS